MCREQIHLAAWRQKRDVETKAPNEAESEAEKEQSSNLRKPGACLQVSRSGKRVPQSGTISRSALRAEPTEWETTSDANFGVGATRGGLKLKERLARGTRTAKRIQSSAKQHVTNLVSMLSHCCESSVVAVTKCEGIDRR